MWVTAAILGAVALRAASSTLWGSGGEMRTLRDNLATEVERNARRLDAIAVAMQKLEHRRLQSLPSDPGVAQSLYQTWLSQLATLSAFSDTRINTLSGSRGGDVFHALRFRLVATAPIDKLTDFLYGFYHSGHLHQIAVLSITPKDNGSLLDIQMTIEALSLDGAVAKDRLPELQSDRTLEKPEVYREKIGGRNLFAEYQPPSRPPAERPPPVDSVDPLGFAEVNGIVWQGDRPEIWINAKMTGKRHELAEGEEFEIGDTKCKVLQIGQRDTEIEVAGKRYRIAYGKSLRDGKLLTEPKP